MAHQQYRIIHGCLLRHNSMSETTSNSSKYDFHFLSLNVRISLSYRCTAWPRIVILHLCPSCGDSWCVHFCVVHHPGDFSIETQNDHIQYVSMMGSQFSGFLMYSWGVRWNHPETCRSPQQCDSVILPSNAHHLSPSGTSTCSLR